jgi:hypothetical protein
LEPAIRLVYSLLFRKICSSSNPTNIYRTTDIVISQNNDLSFWITVHNKLVVSGPKRNSAVLICVLALDRYVPDRRKPISLKQTNLRIPYRIGPTPQFDPHLPAPYDTHADPMLFLRCAVKPQTKHCWVCESKTDLFYFHSSFYSLRLSSFPTLSFSSFPPLLVLISLVRSINYLLQCTICYSNIFIVVYLSFCMLRSDWSTVPSN